MSSETTDEESAPDEPARVWESSAQALIDAAVELFAERGPNEVSVRQIARHAGVNHGLVHYYFGSKSGLVTAVLDHLARARERRTGTPLADALPRLDLPFTISADDRMHLRVLARVVLDGALTPDTQSDFPVVERLTRVARELYGLEADTARLRATQALALLLGWLLFEPWLLRAGGFAPSEADALRGRIVESMTLLGAASPPPIRGGAASES